MSQNPLNNENVLEY